MPNLSQQLRELRERATKGEWWRTDPPWGRSSGVHAGPSDDPHTATCYIADGDIIADCLIADEVIENMNFIAFCGTHAIPIADELDRLKQLERAVAEWAAVNAEYKSMCAKYPPSAHNYKEAWKDFWDRKDKAEAELLRLALTPEPSP